MKIKGFITHKQAEQYADCQDYFSVDAGKKRIAVSDGMTQSIFSAQWAKILVNAFVHNDWDGCGDLADLQKEWLRFAKEELARQEEKGLPTWMLENTLSMRQGAGATLCGIHFDGLKWEGYVLGDSSIVELDADNNIVGIYKSRDTDYDNHPDYYDSFGDIMGSHITPNGLLDESYKLLLVSDPFAELLYKEKEDYNIKGLITELLSIETHGDFVCLVDKWRMEKGMHNDDSTLVIIEYDGNEQFNIDPTIDKLDELMKEETSKKEV